MKSNTRIVKKSNDLIRAYYDLSLVEQRIILIAISYITDSDNRTVEIPVPDYKNLLGVKTIDYSFLNDVLTELRQKSIIITNNNTDENGDIDEFLITGWVNNIQKKKNKLFIEFNKYVWEHLNNLKDQYTIYDLTLVLKFKSKYTIRLFEILKSYAYIGKCNLKIEELRKYLFLEDKYQQFYDFQKKIVEPSIEEINEISKENNTGINVSFEVIKLGNYNDSIKFYIRKVNEEVTPEKSPLYSMLKTLTDEALFISIKSLIMQKYGVIFNEMDIDWLHCNNFSRYALESTYMNLILDYWKNYEIKNPKSFFIKHLSNLSEM